MKILRLRFVAFFVLGIVLNVFSQSNSSVLQIEAADKLFNSGDYTNAVVSYLKLLNDSSIYKQRVIPYRVQMVNLMKRPVEKKDSLKNDSVKPVVKAPVAVKEPSTPKAIDTTSKKSASPKLDLKTKSQYDYVLFQLAQSYRLNADYNNAAMAYKKCVDRAMHPDARYYYALSLMNVKRYQEALNEFEAYVTSNPANDSLAQVGQKKEAGCYLAMDSANINRIIKVTQLDTNVFNKGTSSFGASYYSSSTKMIFTSARKGNVITDPKKEDPAYLCDLYWTELKDSSWSKAQNFGASLNSNQHEGAGFVGGGDETTAIFFTRWNDMNLKESFIYKSKMNGAMFYAAQKLNDNVNMMGTRAMQPCLNADGTKLYFSSNRPGGKGGFDIWVCDVDGNGIAGTAKNMGAPINTAGDEVTPFIHAVTGSLYFSSNGLPGMGGLDIFKCDFNSNENVFAFPVNMNAPLNSSKDDAYFVLDRTQGKGFFSSDRVECEGGNCYKIFEFVNQPIKFDINGIVWDAQTNEPIPNALVSIIETHGNGEPMFIQTNEKGEYFSELKPNSEYFLKAQKNKYLADAGAAVTKEKTKTEHFQQDFYLNTIPKGEIAIEGIEYDFNSAALRPVGMQNLDKVVDLLNLNNNLSVAVEANTDSRGNDAYNMKLSIARAKSCVDYLISKGIAAERLKSKGFGETNPLIKEVEINKMKKKSPEWEAAHQKNRRTALKVIGESEIQIINNGK